VTPGEIFERAARRALELGLAYAGAVKPDEAHRLREAGVAAIVDVRTEQELRHVGSVPGVPLVVWPRGGDAHAHAAFLEEIRARFNPGEALLFLCRSGIRSHHAALLAARAGYARAYNVLEGFEGENGAGLNGWRAAGLPWQRS